VPTSNFKGLQAIKFVGPFLIVTHEGESF